MDTIIPYQPRALTTNEQAGNFGMTHIATITANELSQATANTAQTFTLFLPKAGDMITKVAWRIKTFFKDASDAAFNSTTMSVGDTTAVTTHIAAIQVNENGTEVRQGVGNTLVHYAAANTFTVTFNAMAGKSLVNIDIGEVEILFGHFRPANLEQAQSGATLTK